MKQLTFLLGLVLILTSCTSSLATTCAPNVGDAVEYSVVVDSGSTTAPVVFYYNSTGQMDQYYFPSDSILTWNLCFSTVEANQYLYISAAASPGTNIHSTIKVNGVLVEEGSGSHGIMIDCK